MVKSKKLDVAFAELKENGYAAERNWQCCGSCGWAAIGSPQDEKAVFIHEQGEDRLEERGETYLQWAGDGSFIVSTLEKAGLEVEWAGTEMDAIRVAI